ncbi:MAG: type IV secretory system conjugative DNA transfer family protein, partial [Pyrinomonadaceae bacterium]
AILGTIMTKIFLPGLDDVTAEYASKQLGDTTIFSKTFQDFPGKKQDNTRYAEQKRALMQPNEIRQTAAHSEVLIISDTAPPIRAAYPPFAVYKDIFYASTKGTPAEIHLGAVDAQFLLNAPVERGPVTRHDEAELKTIISDGVDRICTTERLTELVALGQRKSGSDLLEDQIELQSEESDPVNNALNSLPQDVRSVSFQSKRNSFGIEHASI